MRAELLALARLRRAGQLAEAETQVRARLATAPRDGMLWNELGHVLMARHQLRDAEVAFRQAEALTPSALEPALNLGVLLARRGEDDEAALHLEQALALAPTDPLVLSNLGALERQRGRLARALTLLHRSLTRAPDRAATHLNLGLALSDQGRATDGLPHLMRAVTLAPREPSYHDALLLHLHYVSRPRAEVAAAHRRYGEMAALLWPAEALPPRDPDPERRLRVGLVSPDLRQHSVAFFVEPLIEHCDRAQLELVAYSNAAREDETSARLRRGCAAWHTVAALDDAALLALVRGHAVDVLVDLAGHTAGNRLALFARRAAPVQLSYLGYPDVTGLDTMDHRLGDALTDPQDGAAEAGEPLLRLDGGLLAYAPPSPSPPLTPPPCLTNAPPTFGSFNALNKIGDETLALWRRILDGAPGARLLLKHPRLSEPGTRAALLDRLMARGIVAPRVQILGGLPSLHEHLAAYGAVDIALDTFPYHGTTTTCEALWMGLPVVTLAGATHAARVGVSLLARGGLSELVASSPDEYVAIALGLVADRERLRGLREGARERLRQHGLVDGPRAAAAFTRAVRAAWRARVR